MRNVVIPTLTPYLPQDPASHAVIVCPGGALHFLAMGHEGRAVGEYLAERGIAAFVLKYRVAPTGPDEADFDAAMGEVFSAGLEGIMGSVLPLATADADRALEMVRARGYDHVTVLGFSAGARVAIEQVLTGAQIPEAFALLYLPTVGECVAGPTAPPVFAAAAADDLLGIDGLVTVWETWRAAGRPAELHLFERGGHGFGMGTLGLPSDRWPEMFVDWHRSQVERKAGS